MDSFTQEIDLIDSKASAEQMAPVIQIGAIVNKRFKRGWSGCIQSIGEETALVLWSGDKHPSKESLSDLKLADRQP